MIRFVSRCQQKALTAPASGIHLLELEALRTLNLNLSLQSTAKTIFSSDSQSQSYHLRCELQQLKTSITPQTRFFGPSNSQKGWIPSTISKGQLSLVQLLQPEIHSGSQRPFSTKGFDPDREFRRKRLLIATYISLGIGAIVLSAVGLKEYKKFSMAAIGIEGVKVREYGRYPVLFSYRGFLFFDFITKDVKNIHQFEVREDDVWVVTYPKAGTTWVQEIVYLICNDLDFEKTSSMKLDERFPYFEYPYPGKKAIANMPSPRFIKSHLPLSLLPNQIKQKNPKIVYVARNPKDTVVSFHQFMTKFFEPSTRFHGTFEDYCRLFLEDKVFYGPWWKHVLEGWSKRDEENVLFLLYEDLQKDPSKVVREVAEFLGKTLTEDQVQSIVDHCAFDRMKGNKNVNYEWLRDSGIATKDKSVRFMRKGVVGDWKNHLSEETARKFDEMVAEKILPAGIPMRDTLPEPSKL